MAAVLDSLDSQIAVIDRDGAIIYVNDAWRSFAAENGLAADYRWEGNNYLRVCDRSASCGDRDGAAVHAGIRAVLAGGMPAFEFEYPCHSPSEKRWFMMRVCGLAGTPGHFVISHHIITARKLAEERVAEANRELERLAATDRLTGLANRLRLDETLEREIYRAHRYVSPLSVILVDVDHFKAVNDSLGHAAGDAALAGIAGVLRARIRESDLVGRWGGEEFLIVSPGSGGEAARQLAEHLREAVAATALPRCGARTASFGVAECAGDDSPATLVARADSALYAAKHAGRNRVEVAAAPSRD